MSGGGAGRVPLVAGNWKMNYAPTEGREFVESILADLVAIANIEVVVCPPSISIPAVHVVTSQTHIQLGAQNMFYEERGAYTGEISPLMLQGLCSFVILGHSERRAYFAETDELVNRKALAGLAHGLRPIVCVGERLEERDAGLTERVITTQVRGSMASLPGDRLDELVVAYEPVWAIGTGRAATTTDAADVVAIIRALLAEMYGREAEGQVRVLYGGSVTGANAGEFAAVPEIDGSLVGGASLKADFVEIVRRTAEANA